MPTKKWTEEEEEFLKNNYMDVSNAELAEKFEITKNAVQKKLARMGLKRTKVEKKAPVDETPEADAVVEKIPDAVSTESHLPLGNKLFYDDRNYKGAIEEYRQVLKEESDELLKLKARYLMAEAYVKIQNKEEAMEIFRTLAKEYGGHYLGDSAKRRAEALVDYIVPS